MVTERADAPEPGGEPDVQEQGGMFDITPDTSAVDDAPRSTDEGTQLSMEDTPSLTPEVGALVPVDTPCNGRLCTNTSALPLSKYRFPSSPLKISLV